jgi:hypothetical protein
VHPSVGLKQRTQQTKITERRRLAASHFDFLDAFYFLSLVMAMLFPIRQPQAINAATHLPSADQGNYVPLRQQQFVAGAKSEK